MYFTTISLTGTKSENGKRRNETNSRNHKQSLSLNEPPSPPPLSGGRGRGLPGKTFQTPVGMEEFRIFFFSSSFSELYSNLLSVRSTFPASFQCVFFTIRQDCKRSSPVKWRRWWWWLNPFRWLHFFIFAKDECWDSTQKMIF